MTQADITRATQDKTPASRGFVARWASTLIEKIGAEVRADREARKALERRLESTDQLLVDVERRLAALEARNAE